MKLERLIYILLALLNKRQITAKEIAARFRISTRTVYRDMDTLSLAGIPIYSERGDKGGFYIPDDYKMDSSFFTEEEKQFIINMSQNVGKIVGRPSFDSIEHKLASQESAGSANPFYFDLSSWSLNTNYLLKIEQAIQAGQKISFSYYSKKQERSQRMILPYRLVFKLNAWYVVGFCLDKSDFRFFKLSRIRQLQLIGEETCPKDYPLLSQEKLDYFLNPPKEKVEGSKEEIDLQFAASALPKIYDHFTEEEISIEETGIRIHAFRALTPAFFELLLSFGQQVKVLSPSHLQEQLIQTLQKNLQQYDSL
ncbi:helix-turn-helix transcriptional regulator [Streptococcus panodentis]|uniref:YafY family transcriptional regulator n=1 Tax=Streptococcus panodentis TaxID=1581472 RepID=A0ABS5AUV7_9STRE|nr:YafY family protein [Streptococcus panodentis]MBP2620356.1 YafY family transcriptional regulator [Streptococcus panodentis]